MPKDALTKWVVFIITFSLTVNVLSNTMRAVFHGHQNMADDAKATIFLSVILTLLGFAVLKAGYGLITFAAVHLVASIMEFFYILVLYRKYGKLLFRFRILETRQILSQSFAFGFQSFFATAYYLLDSNMLAFMKGDEAVGYYNAAYRFITILTFIAIAIARSFYPAISNAQVHAPRDLPGLFSKGFRITLWTGLTLAVGSHLWAKPIILKTFGESFSPSILPLQILGWVLVFLFINNYFGSVLRAMEQQNYTAKTTSFAFLINFVLNLLIIPGYGFNGAAVTALITEIFVTVMYLRVIHTEGLLKTINPLMVIKTLVSSGFMAAVRILPESLWIVQIPAALMLNGAVTLLLRLFSKEELRGLFGLQNRFLKGSS